MLVTSSWSCWHVCCFFFFCLFPSKTGSRWLTWVVPLLMTFFVDVEKKEGIFSLLFSTVWHQETRRRTLTVFNHRMETLISLTVFVDSECYNLTFLMTYTPYFFHSPQTLQDKTRNYSETRREFRAPHQCTHYKRAYWKLWRLRSRHTCVKTRSGKVKKAKT